MEACGSNVENYIRCFIGGCQKNIYGLNDENIRRHVKKCREIETKTKKRKG